nr:zinc-ribbon domain-containing protein [uncultured Methanobrevibacter sp.]
MSFCSNCGKEVKDSAKFCPACGASMAGDSTSSNSQNTQVSGTPCPNCGSIVPFGNVACTNCGSMLNPDKHTAAIVIGYICSFLIPIVGIITGIYLLTRPNRDVHKHGIIMIVVAIVFSIVFWLLFSYFSYVNSMRYYSYYY